MTTIINLPKDSELVSDTEEEVFLIYTDLQAGSADSTRGLGHLNSRTDLLELKFELSPTEDGKKGNKVIEIQLAQDKTSLRSRKGDTGSVIWRASIDFAQLLLQQCYFPSADGLIDPARLRDLHVLELGAGTGLLGILLMSFVRHYTLTDVASLVPLIRKNLALNTDGTIGPNVSVQELDWLMLQSTPANLRSRFFSFTHSVDIILVVDCIYHPSLIPGLVETIDFLSVPMHTTVIIVVELRAEDVVRNFLELWMAKPSWEICRVGRQKGLQKPYVMWVGMKTQ